MSSSAKSRTAGIHETAPPANEAAVLGVAFDVLREALPARWELDMKTQQSDGQDVDAIVRVGPRGGPEAIVLVEAKRLVSTRDAGHVVKQLQRAASRWGTDQDVVSLVAARYLAPSTRERIAELGAGYVDATGNLLVRADRPALFVRDRGADRDPWRGPGRPRGTLQGAAAARVVRGLIDFAPPYTIPELVQRSRASNGATYRVVEFVEEEGLLERQRYGPVLDVRWRALLERWSQDYGFASSNTVRTFLEPRGLSALTDRLRDVDPDAYAVTGSLAAERLAPYAPARLATLYARDPAALAEELALRGVEGAGANVAIADAGYDAVLARTRQTDGITLAAPAQVAVDLLSGPGRAPSEATALLDWMEGDERAWRG